MRYTRLKIGPIGLALRRRYMCPQPRGNAPFPVVSRELLLRPMQGRVVGGEPTTVRKTKPKIIQLYNFK